MANPAYMPKMAKKKCVAKEWFRDLALAEGFAATKKAEGFSVHVAELKGREWSVTVFEAKT